MSEPTPEPDWNALPRDPQRFFGLEAGFTRKDLKRSYARLIRLYKPEQRPAEFQRIRAAFEQLESELRYGRASGGPAADTAKTDWDANATERDSGDTPPASEAPSQAGDYRGAIERIVAKAVEGSPERVYKQLAAKTEKSPFDFYTLAVLSDVVQPANRKRFTKWLLKGLQAFPYEAALLHLLREDLASAAAEEDLPELLVAAARAVPRDDFYAVAEPAWERFLRARPFADFVKLLAECESHLRDVSIGYRVTFMIRVLRFAIWSDEREWVASAFDFVEENFQQIPRQLEGEIDLLLAVKQYAAVREEFLNGNALRERLDGSLRKYLTEEQAVGDREVLERQVEMLNDPQAVLEAFPAEASEALSTMYTAWSWAVAEVADRCATAPQALDYDLWQPRATTMLREAERRARKSSAGRRHQILLAVFGISWAMFTLMGIFGSVLAVTFVTLQRSLPEPYEGIVIIVGIIAAAIFGGWVVTKLFAEASSRWMEPYEQRVMTGLYISIWRPEALAYLGRSHIPFHVFQEFTRGFSSGKPDKTKEPFLNLNRDFGLAFYSLALPFSA